LKDTTPAHLNKQARHGDRCCHPSYAGRISRRSAVQAGSTKSKRDLISKIPKTKKDWWYISRTRVLAY
jgi:hypothetical protein